MKPAVNDHQKPYCNKVQSKSSETRILPSMRRYLGVLPNASFPIPQIPTACLLPTARITMSPRALQLVNLLFKFKFANVESATSGFSLLSVLVSTQGVGTFGRPLPKLWENHHPPSKL